MATVAIDFTASNAATQITDAGATQSGSGGTLIEGAGYLPGRSEHVDFTGFSSASDFAGDWLMKMNISPQSLALGKAHNSQLHQSDSGEYKITSITRASTTATVECVEHGLTTGDNIYIGNSDVSAWNALWSSITVTDSDTFTFTCAGTESDDNPSSAVFTRSHNKMCFFASPTAGIGNEYLLFYRQSNGTFSMIEKSDGGTQDVIQFAVSSVGKGDVAELALEEVSGVVTAYLDGIELGSNTREAAATTASFQEIHVGGGLSAFGEVPMGDGYIADFLLTNEETYPAIDTGNKLIFFGDSYVNRAAAGSTYGIGTTVASYGLPTMDSGFVRGVISRAYKRTGVRYNILGHGNDGHGWSDSHGNPLQADRADMLSNNPTIVWCKGSVNDIGSPLAADYQTSWEDHIDTILAHSSVNRVIVSTIPPYQTVATYNTSAIREVILEANAIIRNLANYNSNVWVFDEFEARNGFGVNPETVIGSAVGTSDTTDLHPTPRGEEAVADLVTDLCLEALTGYQHTEDRRFITGGERGPNVESPNDKTKEELWKAYMHKSFKN